MDKIKQAKAEYVEQYLKPALVNLDAQIVDVEYTVDGADPEGMYSEAVVVTFEGNGGNQWTKTANVSWDSKLGIWKDVTKQILMDL